MIRFQKITKNGSEPKIEMSMDSSLPWPEVVENLLNFLRACGYVIPYDVTISEGSEDSKRPD
jgi:hypothetical protein